MNCPKLKGYIAFLWGGPSEWIHKELILLMLEPYIKKTMGLFFGDKRPFLSYFKLTEGMIQYYWDFSLGFMGNYLLGNPEVTANLYCNFAYLYWEGFVICSIYLRYLLDHPVSFNSMQVGKGSEHKVVLYIYIIYT